MKHTKLLVVALLVALLACLSINAMADTCSGDYHVAMPDGSSAVEMVDKDGNVTTSPIITATCYQTGLVRYHCKQCGNYWTKEIAKTAHKWNDTYDKHVDSTCTKQGYNARSCQNPGCTEVTDKIMLPLAPHSWYEMAPAKAAGCTTPGCTALERCSVCDARRGGEVVAATGHDLKGADWLICKQPTCAKEGLIGRFCKVCQATVTDDTSAIAAYAAGKAPIESKSIPKLTADKDHTWELIIHGYSQTCTTTGCKDKYECKVCGATKGGDLIPADGHDLTAQPWLVIKNPTCAKEGLIGRFCKKCQSDVTTDAQAMATTKKPIESKTIAKSTTHTQTPVQIIAGKPATCEKDGCKPLTQCPECGKIEGGEVIKAKGHKFGAWIDIQKPTCTQEGIRYRECSNTFCDNIAVEGFGHRQQEKTAAFGHRATWKTTKEATATEAGFAELKCDICGTLLASQIYYYGQTAPSGTVSTANNVNISAKSTNLVKQDPTGISATKTAPATKTNTKSTATKSTTKSTTSTASTKTAAAAPAAAAAAPAAKKVATVAAVKAAPVAELEPNQAQLVADKHLYVVKNVAGEEIVLTVNIVDGKITVEANLAEGESLVLYANAEAIENPTAENTLVLTANEAVELPEAFQNAIVAVVKTESLPTALAAK